MLQPSPTPVAPGKKRRPPLRPVNVDAIDRVTPGVIRVTFAGPTLLDFGPPKPGGHMKLFFVPPSMQWPPSDPTVDAPRPPSRTYTPRRHDGERGRLEVEFALHGPGVAANWAQSARVGDTMWISGPGGGYPVPEGIARIVIAADDTALPAAGMILESLPAGCQATILCEVGNAAEARPLSPMVASRPEWFSRNPGDISPGELLEKAIASLPPQEPDTYWWVACEAGTMRRIRDRLTEIGVDRAHLHTRGYWKRGDTNYPDHDYGND